MVNNMSPVQQIAIDHYVLLGAEVVHPRFSTEGQNYSRVFTVNAGYE